MSANLYGSPCTIMSYSVKSCLRISNFHNKLIICIPHKLSIFNTSVKYISHTVVQSLSQVDPFLVLVLLEIYIQLRAKVYIRLLNKPYENKVRAKRIFKILLVSWNFWQPLKKIRSFNTENLLSVGQRAANLSAVNFGGLKKNLPPCP